MSLVEWSENLSVQIPSVDLQHRKLIELLNTMHDAMIKGAGKDKLSDVLNGLANYTVTHFKYEEELMTKYRYPSYAEHKAIHDNLIQKVKDLQQKFAAGTGLLTIEVMNFLKSWLNEHILKEDKGYSAFLIEKGVK